MSSSRSSKRVRSPALTVTTSKIEHSDDNDSTDSSDENSDTEDDHHHDCDGHRNDNDNDNGNDNDDVEEGNEVKCQWCGHDMAKVHATKDDSLFVPPKRIIIPKAAVATISVGGNVEIRSTAPIRPPSDSPSSTSPSPSPPYAPSGRRKSVPQLTSRRLLLAMGSIGDDDNDDSHYSGAHSIMPSSTVKPATETLPPRMSKRTCVIM
jgi:hypothetical protein